MISGEKIQKEKKKKGKKEKFRWEIILFASAGITPRAVLYRGIEPT